jgi:AcrR family transcriptional regulator
MADAQQRRGRPRDSDVDRRVLAAARETIEARGYAGLSIEAVAERAGVAKTTIYRRWPSKAWLVADLTSRLPDEADLEVTGDVRADLTRQAAAIAAELVAVGAPLVADLTAAMAHDPEFATAMRARWAPRRQVAIEALQQAVRRGEVDPGLDPATVVDQLVGPLYYRLLCTGDPPTRDYAERLVESLLVPAHRPEERS